MTDVELLMNMQKLSASMQKLDWAECSTAYNQQLVSKTGNFLVVAKPNNESSAVLIEHWPQVDADSREPAYLAIGSRCVDYTPQDSGSYSNDPSCIIQKDNGPDEHIPYVPVDYCKVKQRPELCKVSLGIYFLIAVLIANVIKLCCFILLFKRDHQPLTTIGDAVETFLVQDCPYKSKDRLLLQGDGREVSKSPCHQDCQSLYANPGDHPKRRVHRWYHAASMPRWLFTLILYVSFPL